MNQEGLTRSPQVAEVDLVELFMFFWARRYLLVGFVVLFAAAAAVLAVVLPKKYEARVVIAPVSDDLSAATASGALGGLGGLASLVGLSSPADDNKAVALATLESDGLTSAFIEQHDLRKLLFAKDWDEARGSWREGTGPSVWKANQRFAKLRDVTTEKKNGLVILAITWRDPAQAAAWANGLVRDANAYLKAKALTQVRRNIAYLESQARKSEVVETRQNIYELLRSEIRKEMLAEGSDEYALRVVDAAVASEKPAGPKPLLWTLGGAVLGAVFGMMFALLRRRTPGLA